MIYPAVQTVATMDEYHLILTFDDGETRIFDVRPYLDSGVFRALRDPAVFKAVRVVFDTIEWPNGADLCPETLYRNSIPASAAAITE